MKLNSNGVKTARVANQKSMGKQALVFIVLALAIVAVIAISAISTSKQRELVNIAVLNETVQQGDLIVASNLGSRPMIASEYNNEAEKVMPDGTKKRQIILADDVGVFQGTNVYAANYIRAGVPLYYEYFTTETTKKNSYLYKMDGELIKLDVSADVFGDMIVPGDKVNIRCMYTETTYNLPTVAEYEAMSQLGLATTQTEEKITMLFSEVSILDMLNGSGQSIFDYYYDFITWSVAKQQEAIDSGELKANTAPSQIILCVTAEEAENYMRLQNKGPKYMLTLLPRDSESVILDALNSLQNGNTTF